MSSQEVPVSHSALSLLYHKYQHRDRLQPTSLDRGLHVRVSPSGFVPFKNMFKVLRASGSKKHQEEKNSALHTTKQTRDHEKILCGKPRQDPAPTKRRSHGFRTDNQMLKHQVLSLCPNNFDASSLPMIERSCRTSKPLRFRQTLIGNHWMFCAMLPSKRVRRPIEFLACTNFGCALPINAVTVSGVGLAIQPDMPATPSSRDAGETSGSSQRSWRDWGSSQRTGRRGSNRGKVTGRHTCQGHDGEASVKHQSRMCCAREKCAHACEQAGVVSTATLKRKRHSLLKQRDLYQTAGKVVSLRNHNSTSAHACPAWTEQTRCRTKLNSSRATASWC